MNTIAETSQHQVLSGASAACQSVNEMIDLVAALPTTVLIHGESGTGKERVARGLHEGSDRAQGPFVAINCAALSGALLESELFGYEQGAFTGARAGGKRGLFEAANGGTLFLDEIGELSARLQTKLLRALQERSFLRVGGTELVRTDARVVAATNRDLAVEVGAGNFRSDLFYRLAVFVIDLPALRDRIEDLPALAAELVGELASRLGIPAPALSAEAAAELCRYEWPGNVRELRNVLERALVLGRGGEIRAKHVRVAGRRDESSEGESELSLGVEATLAEVERAHIERVLAHHEGNRSKAARTLGIHRSTLIKKLGSYEAACC